MGRNYPQINRVRTAPEASAAGSGIVVMIKSTRGTRTAPSPRPSVPSMIEVDWRRRSSLGTTAGKTVSVSLNGETTTSSEPSAKKEPKKDSSLPSFLQGSRVQPRTAQEMYANDESDEDMEDAEGLVATQAARQASESWKPVDRGGAVHLGARGGWAAVTSPRRRSSRKLVEEEEEVVVESDDDAGVAWTPYTKDDAQIGTLFAPAS